MLFKGSQGIMCEESVCTRILIPRETLSKGEHNVVMETGRGMPYSRRVHPLKRVMAWGLRRHPTPSERVLWGRLRRKQLDGFKFRRQVIILGWIVDFYCPKARFVVELDGRGHDIRHDAFRDSVMRRYGFEVLRLPSREATGNLPAVLERIRVALRTRVHRIQSGYKGLVRG